MSENPPPKPKKKRRWRRWLLRILLAFVALLVLAVVFHEPLLRWIITYGGKKGAEIAGIELTWTVNGSVTGDLHLRNIKAEGSLVQAATIGEISAEYDAWRFARTRDVDIVKSVAIKDVNAVLDLRKLEPAPDKPLKEKKAPSDKPPPLVWPKTIDIDNINLDITLADGRRLIVRGLSLRIGQGMPGILRCAELSVQPDNVSVKDIAANIEWGDHRIVISGLDLPYNGGLKRLEVDLTRFREDMLAASVEATLGQALAKVDINAAGLFKPPLRVGGDVKVQNLRSQDLAVFQLPPNVSFDALNVDLHVEGPTNTTASGEIKMAGIRAAGAIIDEVVVPLKATESGVTIDALRIVRGTNEIQARAEAKLPLNPLEWQKITWTAHVDANLRDVPALLEKPLPVQGTITLKADAEGAGSTARSVTGHLAGSSLGFENYRLPQLDTDFTLNGQEARLSIPALELGAGNRVALTAAMRMEESMPIRAEWTVQVDDPAALLRTVNLPPLAQPVAAKVALTGKAAFLANDVLNLDANVDLSVKDGRFADAPLPAVEMKARAAKGEAVVDSLQVVVGGDNRIDLTGKARLAAPWTFDVDGNVALPELTSLNGLLAALKAPKIESGALNAKIDLSGDAQPWRSEGRVELNAAKVKTGAMPQPADASVKATFADTTAQLETLQAVLGPWKIVTQGRVTDKEARLDELSIWQNERRLMGGHARVPFDLMQTGKADAQPMDVALNAKDLPVGEIAAAAGIKGLPPSILSLDIKAGGRLDTADVALNVNVREAKVPGLPKSFQPASTDVAVLLRQNKLTVDATALQPPLQPIKLKAEMALNPAEAAKNPDVVMNTPLKATLEQAPSDLSFLREFAPDTVRSLPGKMEVNARVSGTLKAPLIDSNINVDVPEVGFVSPSMPSVRDVRVRLRSHDRTATIEEISVVLAGGRVRVSGNVDATNLQDPRFSVSASATEALVYRDPTSSVRANGNISAAGTLKSARVSGVVEMVRGRVFREVNLMPNLFRIIPQGEDLPPPPPSTARSEQKLELPALMKDWTFDLKVRTHDPVYIAGNLVNGIISADMHVGGTGAAPRITGGANVDRLLVKLPFSQMKITKGVVTMNPDDPFTPNLDVRGESRVGEYDVTMYVYGDASDPKTRFTSSPPLSEADIVTLLGTGITLNGDSSQLASQVATRAIVLVGTEAYRKIFKKKKQVEVKEPKLRISYNPTTPDASGGSVSGSGSGSAQATYEFTPNVRFTGIFMQTGGVRALLGYILRFGKAARAMDEEVVQ
ncbi:MAG: translocation/assembly module TamB domain-containing protein [Prosthecobacter sp.]